MKATPAALSTVAILGTVPPSEKRPIALPGADESVSSFEALLRATPGGRRSALVADSQAADKPQLSMTESAAVLDLLGMALQSSASSRSSPEGTVDDESGQGLVLPDAVASSVLPFWPAHLGGAWGEALQSLASGTGASDGGVQAEPATRGLAQASLAVTALGSDGSLPEQSNVAESRVASVAPGQTAIPAGFVPMDPARETLPVLPALPAPTPGQPLTLTAPDQTPARAPAEVLAKALILDAPTVIRANSLPPGTPISKAAVPSFDLIHPQVVTAPFAVAMASTAAPKPAWRALPVVSEAAGPRLSVEPRPLDSAGVVLAQFGAVSVVAKLHELEQNLPPSALTEVQAIADARGAWVPELGGMVSPGEKFTSPVDVAQHLAEHVDTWVSQNLQVAEFRLQEPSANPVLVRIEMNGQQASVMFRTDVLACREALTTQMNQLSDLLSAQGLQLADASVAGSGADSKHGREARPSPLWGEPAARRSAVETSALAQRPPGRRPASAGRTLDVFV